LRTLYDTLRKQTGECLSRGRDTTSNLRGCHLLGLERFRWEGSQALTPGKHTIVFNFAYAGPGMAKGGTGVVAACAEVRAAP